MTNEVVFEDAVKEESEVKFCNVFAFKIQHCATNLVNYGAVRIVIGGSRKGARRGGGGG